MKTPRPKSFKPGFTLVELLVVIAIIAVLAGAGFTAGTAAIQKARKTTALSVATTLESNVEAFYSEYSALPDPNDATTDNAAYATNSADGIKILESLAGIDSSQNDRKIRFLSLKEAKSGNRDGIVYSSDGNSIQGLYDPWGEPYFIILDYDYDERITITGVPGSNTTLNGRRVAVYSLGTDGTPTSKTVVKSW